MLLPVNPKQAPKNAIGAILWLDENLAGLLLIEPRCLGKEECTDEVRNQLTSGDGTFETYQAGLTMSVAEGKAEAAVPLIQGIVRTKKPTRTSFGSGRLTSCRHRTGCSGRAWR